MLTDSCALAIHTARQRCPYARAGQVFGLYASYVRAWMLSKECACYSYENRDHQTLKHGRERRIMRDQRSTATHRPAGRLLHWVLVVTVGEAIGFLVPAVVGAAVTAAAWAPLPTLIAMVLAGSVEGAVLGAAQSDCLHRWRVLPLRRRWIAATSLGAAVAWSLGMLPGMVGGLNWTIGTVVLVGIGGLILLSSLPLAQYFVLHDHVRRALLWIPINVVAWLLGISWTLVPSPWVDQSTPTGTLILIYGIAGLCMAATVALVTGAGLTRLLLPPLEINGQALVGSHGPAPSVSVRS
jgi:hypothetical protein